MAYTVRARCYKSTGESYVGWLGKDGNVYSDKTFRMLFVWEDDANLIMYESPLYGFDEEGPYLWVEGVNE